MPDDDHRRQDLAIEVLAILKPQPTLYVVHRFSDGSVVRQRYEEFEAAIRKQSRELGALQESIARADATANQRAEGGKLSRAAVSKRNLQAVREAYDKLEPRNKGRAATARIRSSTGLSEPTVRGHLATIRDEERRR